jgi:hypothetical protein
MRFGRRELPKSGRLNFCPFSLLSRHPAVSLCQKSAQVSLGEDQFYPNTCLDLVQAENTKKQVFFTILQFMYGNLPSLW